MGERLVDRLRGLRPIADITGYSDYELINPDGPEAANVITALAEALGKISRLNPSDKSNEGVIARAALSLLRGDAE